MSIFLFLTSIFLLQYEFLSHYEDLHPIYIALVGLSAALLCYYIVLHAVKAKLVVLCYALPLNLLTPLTLLIILVIQKTVDGNPDQSLELLFVSYAPSYMVLERRQIVHKLILAKNRKPCI